MTDTVKCLLPSLLLLLALGPVAACSTSHDPDSGTGTDSGVADSGDFDSSRPDGGGIDSGIRDSAVVDSTRPDAGACVDLPPENDRPVAYACSDCRVPGPGGVMGGECAEDADCTAGDNGRCVWARIGGMCTYDECFSDTDCAAGELCACDGSRGGGNACIEAGCHTNADCGAYTCSPTLGSCGHYTPAVGYFCHTAADACFSDADCGGGYCAYDTLGGTWGCSMSECAG